VVKAARNRTREALEAWMRQQLEGRRLRHVATRVAARQSAGVSHELRRATASILSILCLEAESTQNTQTRVDASMRRVGRDAFTQACNV